MTPHDLDAHRSTLLAHCYRMMGSPTDAEDAVQDTLLKAWKNLDRFEGRSSLKTWLTSIATRVCLDLLESRAARRLVTYTRSDASFGDSAPLAELDTYPLEAAAPSSWIEPLPDARIASREGIRLAWIAALQSLAPRQRAALLMAEVLDYSAAEIAETLSTTVAAVNSALQRARETLAKRLADGPAPRPIDPLLVERFVDAFERYDVLALTQLLRDDAVMSMPPLSIWLEGPAAIGAWLEGRGKGCRGSRLVPTAANGQIAFGQYRVGASPGAPHTPWALVVLDAAPDGQRIESLTYFLDTATVFPRFGLPLELP